MAGRVLSATPGLYHGRAGPAGVATCVQQLDMLPQSVLAAALTAVAMTANAASPACRDELAKCVPDARLLASLRSPGLQEASCTWTVPGFLQLLEQAPPLPPEQRKLVSPAFGSSNRWELHVCSQVLTNAAGVLEPWVSAHLAARIPKDSGTALHAKASIQLLDAVSCGVAWRAVVGCTAGTGAFVNVCDATSHKQ